MFRAENTLAIDLGSPISLISLFAISEEALSIGKFVSGLIYSPFFLIPFPFPPKEWAMGRHLTSARSPITVPFGPDTVPNFLHIKNALEI